jgi:hypothetical protein
MRTDTMPDYPEICLRWNQATVRNSIAAWSAIMTWLAAESMLATCDNLHDTADSMRVLSDLALQHALDLQPQHELEAA